LSADAKKDDAHLVETKVSSEVVFEGKLLRPAGYGAAP
jgi:hypothetical protein